MVIYLFPLSLKGYHKIFDGGFFLITSFSFLVRFFLKLDKKCWRLDLFVRVRGCKFLRGFT